MRKLNSRFAWWALLAMRALNESARVLGAPYQGRILFLVVALPSSPAPR